MKTAFVALFILLCASLAPAQPLCDFRGRDSLFVTVQQDTMYLWDMDVCAYCSAEFSISVTRSADTIYIVQTDTAGKIALCGCLFNLRASITGMAPGTYWIIVQRELLKKYGYSFDVHQVIGTVQCQYAPGASPGLSWKSYQSTCNPNSVPPEPGALPEQFGLLSVYPNPFNPGATVQFRTSKTEHVVLKVYDILGREVQTLMVARTEPGLHNVIFYMPSNVNSGVYYCRMTAGSFSQTKAMVLLR